MQPLDDSWAWAHAQVIAEGVNDIPAAIARGGGAATSRLLCPRRLKEVTSYLACLVPALEGGRLSGIGTPTADANVALQPAWRTSDGVCRLPVYWSWTFRTGPPEDFEELVRRLHAAEPDVVQALGTRAVDATQPWPTSKPPCASSRS